EETLADGAAVERVPDFSNDLLDSLVHGIIGLSEEEIGQGIAYLWKNFNIRSEGTGALATAAYVLNKDLFSRYDQVLTFVTGNNIDEAVFQQIVKLYE
ncbi:hypothetical protein ACFL42_02460, partial [Candidatus Omnitrophota bacterium]